MSGLTEGCDRWRWLRPLLHCTLPCSPGISFSFFFFSPTHIRFLSYTNTCKHTCLCVHYAYSLLVNCNPGNLLTSPPDDHSLILRRWFRLSHLSPVHSSRPLLSSICSLHLNQFRAHSYSHSCSCSSSSRTLIITLFSAENPATCVFSLLLSHTPFTDRAVFSIQGKRISHIFTVITRCWHAGIDFFLSFSVGKQLFDLKHCYK